MFVKLTVLAILGQYQVFAKRTAVANLRLEQGFAKLIIVVVEVQGHVVVTSDLYRV